MNISLLGFMGTGKTAVGKILSEQLSMDFVEMDAIIEQQQNMEITDIFSQKGEAFFRSCEEQLIEKLMHQDNQVISCGGGVIINQKNREKLIQGSYAICLQALPETIYNRTKSNTTRPLLNVDDPLCAISELLEKRKPFYNQFPLQIHTDNCTQEEVAQKIITMVREQTG